MHPETAAEAVANGAQLLDERKPGWYNHIDLTCFSTGSILTCPCAQLDKHENPGRVFPDWNGYARSIGAEHEPYKFWHYGFQIPGEIGKWNKWNYADLTQEWRAAIEARLAVDKLVTSDEREEVPA